MGVRRHRRSEQVVRDVERCHDVMKVGQVPLRDLVPGTVVMASVPYAERNGHKFRPAVVIDLRDGDVIVLPCTSSPRRHDRCETCLELTDVVAAGLGRPTGVRCLAVRLPRWDVVSVYGHLADEDQVAVQQLIEAVAA